MKAKLYINKKNLKYNLDYIKSKIGENKKIIAMVKANAYGAGDVLVASELQRLGVTDFGVANVEEAIRLRKNNIKGMILITSVCEGDEIAEAIENDISMSVSTCDNIKEISSIAKGLKKTAKIHLKIDTGMTRLGFLKSEIEKSIDEILELSNIQIDGIYTHLSCADIDDDYTNMQFKEFAEVLNELSKKHTFKYVHILNSDGTQNYAQKDIGIEYTHVRVGLMLYGYTTNTRPILKLTAPVLHVNYIDKNTKVGYSGSYTAIPNMKVAVLKIGYADGLSRNLSNKMYVKINNVNCQVIGNICMDMCMVDVTNVEKINVNDEAIIFDYSNDLKELSRISSKIVYEFISNLGERIERIME